ncbi:hypothetical protein JVT61DRAFT_14795 [Boletus reticuloceps]|uniref:Uncharacterized protein n=1 Tax=Boletus reticuloceps TaxID=495285 RepID=A0A8I2YUN5_9AGAM|nr:hypothetical protein JVT61DRAFT_14795 [Boletus reticuloceps]
MSQAMPVVTPRPSRSSVSSTFPLSQTSLVSQLRRTSESTTQPATASTVTLPQTPVSSLPSFRSLRNLLPFAPAKTSSSPASPPHTPKPSFVSFGSLRRITHDRKSSVSHSRRHEVETPVIAIARPSQTFEEEMMDRKRSRDINRSTSDPSPLSRTSDDRYVLPLPSSGPPLGADLSTIIEAENSGISKYIPHLGDTTHADGDDDTPTSPFNLERIDKSRIPSPDSRATSVLDLSTSKLAAEVMHALKVEDATTGSKWLKGIDGIVVEEGTDDPEPLSSVPGNAAHGDEDLDAALDFDALDPDLAELLSPNKISGKSQSSNPVASRIPSRAHSRSPSHPASTSSLHPPNGDDMVSARTSPRLGTVAPPLAPRAIVHSSPTRRSFSLSRANPTRGPPSSLPRLTRSVTTAPPSASDSSDGSSTPSGMRGPSKRRHQPPSPLSSQTNSSPVPSPASSHGSTDMPPRKFVVGSRFATSQRHVSSYAPGNSRLTDPSHGLLPSTIQTENTSSSQFSSRSASDPPRQPSSRPSLELGGALEVNKRRRPHLFYNRRRSMSVEETPLSPTSGSASPIRPSSSLSNRPPVMEWLGPRTVKAFAAAGLLDGDRDGPNTPVSGPSKYASLRAHCEREDRFAPSRMAFSEAASTSSWGRSGSVSRMTPSEGGVAWGSPTFSGPRTTFSGSTAPTSISATSSQQAAIQVMKEKHDLETEALLSALSDSQRTTKTLREENLQLRDRIRELEDELDEMRTQIHRLASGVLPPRAPPPSAFSRSPHDRPVLLPSPLTAPRRPTIPRSLSHAHTNGLSVPAVDSPRSSRAASPSRGDSPVPVAVAAPRPRRRRASTSSSVFPNLPQNMSLLMHEESMHDRPGLSSAPPSPPSPMRSPPQRSSLYNGSHNSINGGHGYAAHAHAHAYHVSTLASGTGTISPTIASFSMTEIPGSPSSLQLRPEHELHLGDMASLSLYAMSDEEL